MHACGDSLMVANSLFVEFQPATKKLLDADRAASIKAGRR